MKIITSFINSKGFTYNCFNNISIPKNKTCKIEVQIQSISYESINLPLDPEPEEDLHLLQDFLQFLDIQET